jgi:hypothetical protein
MRNAENVVRAGGGGRHHRRRSCGGVRRHPATAEEPQASQTHVPGYDMTLVANFGINPPTLVTWESQRTDLESAFVVIVTDHWVAVRGRWFCDTHTRGVPVRIKKAPHRRKRVRFGYKITVASR